jgi:hypothetical protein
MTSVTERANLHEQASAARTLAIVWPGALAVLIFALIIYIQFSMILGGGGFIAELFLAIGFYYCWAWHNRLAAKAKLKERAAER